MLYFVSIWIGLSIVCCVIGTAVLNRLQTSEFSRSGDRAIVATWLGIVILATSLLATSLVTPLSPLTGLLVALGLVSASLVDRRTRLELAHLRTTLSKHRILLGLGLAWLVAALTSKSVTWVDTGLYHYSSIQWFANYGSTPGIALLFSNLGFTSAWFALAAPLNPPLLAARAASITNGFAFWLALLSAIVCLNRLLRRDTPQLSDWFLAAYWALLLPIVCLHPLFKVMLASPAPDVSVMFLTGITAWSLMLTLSNRNRLSTTTQAIPLILAAGTMTMKLVAIPLLLVVGLCYLTTSKPTVPRLAIGGGLMSLILGPFVTSSVITSGCPLYPSTLFCLNVPWAPTPEVVRQVAKATHSVTSWVSAPPLGIHPWLWAIWKFLSQDTTSVLFLLSSAGAIVFVGYAVKRFQLQPFRIYAWITGINVTGITFLLLTSPFSRFTLPYVVVILALAISTVAPQIYQGTLAQSWLTAIDRRFARLGARPFLQWSVLVILVLGIGIRFDDRWILPPPMQAVPTVQKQVNNITYWSPTSEGASSNIDILCWSAPVPCAFDITPDVWLRDAKKGIAGGFVRR